jgi:ADP-heptose:LPS heptosyltransferase
VERVLVIHFGQMGDVLIGLPAFGAVRRRYPGALITALTGKPADQVMRMSGLVDEVIGVDRVALRDGPRLESLREIARLACRLRRARYDVALDLHAFYETGLLALYSGAPVRVGPRRQNRSLSWAYTVLAPQEDLTAHVLDRYLAVTSAVGAAAAGIETTLSPPPEAEAMAATRLADFAVAGDTLVGVNPGAGFEGRRWPAECYVELGRRLASRGCKLLVFAGPEEPGLGAELAARIGPAALGCDGRSISELAALMRRCALVVSNDTGPSHVSAAVGTPTLVLMAGNAGPSPFAVRGERHKLIYGETILAIGVDEVEAASCAMLGPGNGALR